MRKPVFVRSNGLDFCLLFSLFLDDPELCLAEGGIKKKGRRVRERASERTEREEAVPVEGTCALNRAPNSEDFHKK